MLCGSYFLRYLLSLWSAPRSGGSLTPVTPGTRRLSSGRRQPRAITRTVGTPTSTRESLVAGRARAAPAIFPPIPVALCVFLSRPCFTNPMPPWFGSSAGNRLMRRTYGSRSIAPRCRKRPCLREINQHLPLFLCFGSKCPIQSLLGVFAELFGLGHCQNSYVGSVPSMLRSLGSMTEASLCKIAHPGLQCLQAKKTRPPTEAAYSSFLGGWTCCCCWVEEK
jgi:hypothetical protein